MSKPYKGSDGSWYNAGKKMDALQISIMNESNKNKAKNKSGLGLNNTKINTITKPIQKKPRPPTREERSMNTIDRLKERKNRFKNMFSFGQ